MGKKRKSVIPEFGRQKPKGMRPAAGTAQPAAPAVPRAPVVKPQSTNAKSGRRGA